MPYDEQMITWKMDLFAPEDFSSSNGLISYNFVSQESHNQAGLATFRSSCFGSYIYIAYIYSLYIIYIAYSIYVKLFTICLLLYLEANTLLRH